MTEKVYKDAKGVLYKVDAIGELGNADRSKLSILMLPVKPGATWRKKPMAPTWSLNCEKDASQGLDAMAEENHWQPASEAEVQYNARGRAEQLDDLAKKTGTPLTVLSLSVRTMACLQRTSIRDVEELAAMSDEQIMRIRDMGRKGYEEIRAALGREERNDIADPTPTDDLPWSVAATVAADEPAESPEPADLTPTTETVAAVSEQADNAATVVPASDGAPAAFDYSGLDEQTVMDLHLAEREYTAGKKLTEMGLRRMADGVAIAHEALCVTSTTKCRTGENGRFALETQSFGSWCDSVGLNRKAAERLLQVSRLFDASSPKEQKVLEDLSPSLLYAAAKPSAPEQLVQGVKDGDITTHKQYKALEKQLAEERELRRQAEVGRDAAVKDVRQLEKEQAEDRQWMDSEIEKANQKVDLATKKSAEAWEQVVAEKTARKQAEKERDEATNERDGARQALQAAKLRGDKLKAENDDLKSRPIEAQAIEVDSEEIERRVQSKVTEMLATQNEGQARRDYDQVILALRNIDTAWQSLATAFQVLPDEMKKTLSAKVTAQIEKMKEETLCL